ncbi:UNVERIFIED_CONTAM: hypothetical protein FKN15_041793 [Acipenser sinensis]
MDERHWWIATKVQETFRVGGKDSLTELEELFLQADNLQLIDTFLKDNTYSSGVVSENEALVSDWMKTIEQILNEGGDDRVLDINTTPLTELDRWQRRQRSLESITEQLKGKECRNVIGLLISTKSRLLKKWKAVDISITDVANDTKSRVKYLEALHRHFDALASENNPVNLMNTVLPGIVNTIKQIDAMSRFFSRNAYLGLLLTKSATGLPTLALHHQSESKRLVPLEETSEPQQLRSEEEEEEEEEEAVNTLSYEEKLMLRNLYNWNDPEDEGCSLSSIISDYLNNMINTMASAVRTEVLLGVEKRDLDKFEDVYSEFLVMNQQLERYLSIYIQALFLRKMHTQEALSILKRFSVVGQRQGIQPVINECYVEALEWFYEEIKEVQETYEEQKDDPVLPRNLPPAAGAIYWSRQLLSKIEEPMKEKKFKMYKSHLQGILQEYQCVKKAVPECLAVQFAAQLEYVNRHFQPGLSLLAWNSVNIEAFLHHVYKDITRLRALVEKAAQIKETVIDKALEAIQNLELFSADEVLSESRSPTEFLQLIRSSLQKKQAELEQIVKTIKTAISDVRFSIKNTKTGKAVFACVCRSLLVLAQVTGCDMERIIAEVSLNHQEEVHTGSSTTASDTGTNTASEVSSSSIIRSTISEVMMDQKSHLRCSLKLRLTIPTIVIDPTCEVAQDAVNEAALAVLDLTDCVNWGPGETQEGTLISTIREDKTIQHILRHINHVIISLKPTIEKHIFHYSYYDFLWKDDMNCQYAELTSVNSELLVINKVVERIHKIEQKIQDFSPVFQVGCLWLDSSVIRDTLKGFAGVWKFKYSSVLHQDVKSFGVDVIQFRNSFDTQGPAAPGLKPEEAVHQLQEFQEKFKVYDAKKKTLNSLQRLFGITPKAFPELDRTRKDLQLLGTLYELFQKFLSFDQRFRDTLWAEVNLKQSNAEEIRNRHWLQVMTVTGSSFPLEATVFKLHHLLGIELLKHQKEINSIATAASEELKLEVKMRTIEEEWAEQVLSFEAHRNRGPLLLVKEDSVHMLEQVEDARLLLAHMLTSKHIGPLREEAASWSEKLKEVGAVLELWLEVQDLWQNLESVFSDPNIAKELPQDAKRFAKVERNWIKMMRSANNTKNVLQCCCAEELPKEVVLRNMYKELEICCQSLTSFLDRRRQAFPRFYFLPDLVLLSFISHPTDIGSLQKHFG